MNTKEKRFPIQGGLSVTWEAAERAYNNYVRMFGGYQSLERLSERGGFGVYEYAWLWNGARADEQERPRDDTIARALRDGEVRAEP